MSNEMNNFECYEPTDSVPVPTELQNDTAFKQYIMAKFGRDSDSRFIAKQVEHLDRILGTGFMAKLKEANGSDYYKALSFGFEMTSKKKNWSSLFACEAYNSNALDVYGSPDLIPVGMSMSNSEVLSFFYDLSYRSLSEGEQKYISVQFDHPVKPVIKENSPTMWVNAYMCWFDTEFDSSLLEFRRSFCQLHDEQFLPDFNLDAAMQANCDFLSDCVMSGRSICDVDVEESVFCQLIRKGYIHTAIKQAMSHIYLNTASHAALHPEIFIAYDKFYNRLSEGEHIDFNAMLSDIFNVKRSAIPQEIENYAELMLQIFIGSSCPSVESKAVYNDYHNTPFSRLIFGVFMFGDKKHNQKVTFGVTGEHNRVRPLYKYLDQQLSKGKLPQESVWSMYSKRYAFVFNAISPYFTLKEGVDAHLTVKNRNWEQRILFYRHFLEMSMFTSQLVVDGLYDAVSELTSIENEELLYV